MASDDKSSPAPKVEFTPPATELQRRVPLSDLDLNSALARANASLEKMRDEYRHWAELDATRLDQAYAALAELPESQVKIEQLYRICHDMKGLAGTFDFQLVTDILHNLCRYLENRRAVDAHQLHVTKLHVDAARLVIESELTGDGGSTGATLMQGLQEIIAKEAADKP